MTTAATEMQAEAFAAKVVVARFIEAKGRRR
jgi:hypothetical protein